MGESLGLALADRLAPGATGRIRTCNLLITNQLRYRLRYDGMDATGRI